MKSDLGGVLSMAEVNEFSKSLQLTREVLTVEASAMDGTNIMNIFEKIAFACKSFDTSNASTGCFQSNDYHILGVNSMPLALMGIYSMDELFGVCFDTNVIWV